MILEDGFFEYLFSYWQLLAMYLLGLLSLFCILFSYKKLQQNFRLSTELSLLEQEEHSLNRYVEEAKTRYDRTKSFRHDIRNHIAVVKRLLQSEKLEEAITYMEDLDDMAEKMSFPCSTNNPAVDILVGNKLGIAQSMGIDVACSLLLPYPCSLRDIDICIVLSNALDNAIQAVKRLDTGMEKYIHVSGRIQGDFLMMEIKNSFHGKGTFKKGTGLSNVKKVAEKYVRVFICGIFVCHADFKSSLLYAALTVEIMLLCYGIVKSLIGLLCSWMPDLFNTAGIAVMLTSEAASLLLIGFCYYMVYRYFSDYTTVEMQQMFLVFIPIIHRISSRYKSQFQFSLFLC